MVVIIIIVMLTMMTMMTERTLISTMTLMTMRNPEMSVEAEGSDAHIVESFTSSYSRSQR